MRKFPAFQKRNRPNISRDIPFLVERVVLFTSWVNVVIAISGQAFLEETCLSVSVHFCLSPFCTPVASLDLLACVFSRPSVLCLFSAFGPVDCADALGFSAFAAFFRRLQEFYCLFVSFVARIFFFGLSARPSNGSCVGLVASLLWKKRAIILAAPLLLPFVHSFSDAAFAFASYAFFHAVF